MTEGKQRHGCFTSYLVLMIITNSLSALLYLVASKVIMRYPPYVPLWVSWVLAVAGIVNVVCAIALFRWKKWGFFGFIGTSIIVAVVNLSVGLNILAVLLGLSGILVLFGVLQIGKERKGWTQLE